jgi:putative hydrolase of the HAD superfamily
MTDTAIFFDLDGTLVQLDRPYEEIPAAVLETHLGTAPPELVGTYSEAFFEAFRAFDPEPYHAGMEAALAAAEGDPDADPDAMVATLREVEFDALAVDEAAPESVANLAEDAAVGVLTNGVDDWQRAKLAHVGLDDQFDAVLTSYEVGAHKPDAAIFEAAADRLPAEEYAMVGDSDDDVEGARAAGWVPVRYEDAESAPNFWETVGALL